MTALRRLPVRQRQVITLRLLLDLDTETTARVLGISGGTVSSHLKRALDALRGELGPPSPSRHHYEYRGSADEHEVTQERRRCCSPRCADRSPRSGTPWTGCTWSARSRRSWPGAGPAGRRRSLAIRAAVACGTAAATVAAVIAVTGGASGAPAPTGASAARGPHGRVRDQPGRAGARQREPGLCRARGEQDLGAHRHLVVRPRSRFVEYTGNACGHALANGACTHRGGSELYLADGTALINGKLVPRTSRTTTASSASTAPRGPRRGARARRRRRSRLAAPRPPLSTGQPLSTRRSPAGRPR